MLWHPQERLWNRTVLQQLQTFRWQPAVQAAKAAVIGADTLLLALRAARERLVDPGAARRELPVPDDVPVYYLDLGTHADAAELTHLARHLLPRLARRWEAVGFEASRELYAQAHARLEGVPHVRVVHAALCHQPPPGGTLRLYHRPGGLGNSLYRPEAGGWEDAPALRLTDWLGEQGWDLERGIGLLRMNIEGAEAEVVADLLDTGAADHLDGFFGMWNDLSWLDPPADRAFRARLDAERIKPFTFNGRDLRHRWRLRIIDYHVRTCVRRGLRRVQAVTAAGARRGSPAAGTRGTERATASRTTRGNGDT